MGSASESGEAVDHLKDTEETHRSESPPICNDEDAAYRPEEPEIPNPRKIFIGNLPINVDEDDLRKEFSEFGPIVSVECKSRSMHRRGFAFVEYETEGAAADAIAKMDGSRFLGDRIQVHKHQPGTKGPRGPPSSQIKPPPPKHLSRRPNGGDTTRTGHRILLFNLDDRVSWQDLKDFGRNAGEVNFANVFQQDGAKIGVLEYFDLETKNNALQDLGDRRLYDKRVTVEVDNGQYDRRQTGRQSRRSPRGPDTRPAPRRISPYKQQHNRRQEHRHDPRQDHRQEPRHDPRQDHRQEPRHDPRQDPRQQSRRYSPPRRSSADRRYPAHRSPPRRPRSTHRASPRRPPPAQWGGRRSLSPGRPRTGGAHPAYRRSSRSVDQRLPHTRQPRMGGGGPRDRSPYSGRHANIRVRSPPHYRGPVKPRGPSPYPQYNGGYTRHTPPRTIPPPGASPLRRGHRGNSPPSSRGPREMGYESQYPPSDGYRRREGDRGRPIDVDWDYPETNMHARGPPRGGGYQDRSGPYSRGYERSDPRRL